MARIDHLPRPTTATLALSAILAALGSAQAHASGERPPDLRLEWPSPQPTAIRGHAGETVEVAHRLRNVGGRDAFAAVIDARTALGPVAGPDRLQPGPRAGAAIDRSLRLALATGMRELCIDVRLQTLEPEDPGDPNPRDNRICRPIEIDEVQPTRGEGSRATTRDIEEPP